MNTRVKDMSGQRFSSLIAVKTSGRAASGDLKWEFLCDCGARFVANGYYARIGKITCCPSCSKERGRQAILKHGLTDTPEYRLWTDIQTRCHNQNSTAFKNYGGRGIVVCERWRSSFENFLADMGKRPPGLTIERDDVNGNYEPGNCRWATRAEQANNKRNNVNLTIGGVTKTVAEWAAESGLSYDAIWQRHRSGKTQDQLIAKQTSRRSRSTEKAINQGVSL